MQQLNIVSRAEYLANWYENHQHEQEGPRKKRRAQRAWQKYIRKLARKGVLS